MKPYAVCIVLAGILFICAFFASLHEPAATPPLKAALFFLGVANICFGAA